MKTSKKLMTLLLAIALLAGIALTGCSGKGNASKLPTLKILTDDTDTAKRYAQAFQGMWQKELGIKVEIDSTTFKDRLQRTTEGDFQIVMAGWGPDYNDPMTFMDMWVTDGEFNEGGYANPEYDDLIAKAKVSPDNDERMDLMAQAEKILIDDMAIAPIYFRNVDYVKNDKLKGEVRRALSPDPDFYWASIEDGDSISINISTEPPDMDPQTTTDAVSFTLLGHLFEGLTRLDQDSSAMPGIAKDWDVSEDGLTWTFNLRDDAVWSNGDPVTAHDFEYGWKRALDPELASQYAYIVYDHIKNGAAYYNGDVGEDEVGVKALDDTTLEVVLENPAPYFDTLVTFGTFMPLNKEYHESIGDKYAAEADNMIYNGPYVMSTWDHDSKIVLEKNPSYWNADAIQIETINHAMINDSTSALNKFLTGELDMVGIPGTQREQVEKEGYELLHYADASSWYFLFNLKDDIMANENIRKALANAIDRKTFVEKVVQNDSDVGLGFVPYPMPGKSDSFRKEVGDLFKDNDIEAAKKYLEQGIEELGLK